MEKLNVELFRSGSIDPVVRLSLVADELGVDHIGDSIGGIGSGHIERSRGVRRGRG